MNSFLYLVIPCILFSTMSIIMYIIEEWSFACKKFLDCFREDISKARAPLKYPEQSSNRGRIVDYYIVVESIPFGLA